MSSRKKQLEYAIYLKRLYELFVIKENIAFEYQHAHYNWAAAQIDKEVDRCLDNNLNMACEKQDFPC